MADVQQTPPGAWPWGKGKETHQEQPPEYFDDSKKAASETGKEATKSGKDAAAAGTTATPASAKGAGKEVELRSPISMKDKETPKKDADQMTNGEVPDTARTEDVQSEVGDKTDKATSKAKNLEITEEPEQLAKGGEQNPLAELQEGLRAGNDDEASGQQKPLTEVEPEPLSDEMKAKLTPGKDVDVAKLLKEGKSEDEIEAIKEGEEVPKDAGSTVKGLKDVDTPKEGEEALKKGEEIPKEGEEALKEGEVPKEGEEALKGGQEIPKEGEEAVKKGEDALPEGEVPKDGEEVTEKGEGVLKQGDEALPEGEDVTKKGEDALKESEEALPEGEVPKEGEDALKTGEEIPKEGEEALKEGEEKGDEALKEGEEAIPEEAPVDLSILKNGKVNKGGNVINEDGKVVGRIMEGVLAHLVGKRVDENGAIWNDSGKIIGKAELIPEDEREGMTKETAPFEAFPDATVDSEGYVVFNDERVGKVVDGDIKKLRGMKVDQDGDILDRAGNVVGKAERWEPEKEPEPEPEPEKDRSILAGKRVNKAGNVVDSSGTIFGRVVEGDPKRMIGRMCDKLGNILSESGDVVGKAEVVPEGEREGMKEGPFAELSGCTVTKDGKVVTPGGDVVGRLIKGDPKVLFGRLVDEDGDICDKNGNVLGKAERWEEEVVEKKKNPMAGRRVNREGNVVDEDGNLIGKLTSGELSICAGKEIDDDGDVVDNKGTTIGHVSLIEDIPPAPVEEETPEEKEKRETAEKDKKLAQQMAYCLTQVLDKIKPICDMITRKIDKAERTPKEELDEEELVREVRPLIEEGGKILQEANGIIRGLDPDGRIQANAKHKSATREATPEEHHLADILKELTGTVTQTIENAKKKIEGMPHAKKELNPLWGLLSEPLFQILAAVGLLLNGVLGIVGRLLSGLGLGGLVDGLLGTLGIKNILEALGVGSLTDALTGKNQKKGKSKGLLGLGG